ncbi:MAG: hypothetical protein LBO78_00240 [Rickettsiales bacterium]|jgi:hypothetical protein|nr:hypothetical protein [Rickettsiales bacterium]
MKKTIIAIALAAGIATAGGAQAGVLGCTAVCEQTREGKIYRECIRACEEVNACFAEKGCSGKMCARKYPECEK